MIRGSLIAGSLLGWLAACGGESVFACSENAQCNEGTCQSGVGFCSFPDPMCPSGERFGEHAALGFANECVELPDNTTGPDPTTSGEPALDSSGDQSRPCPPDWWDCGWSSRMALDVTWEGASLPGFPVRVSLRPDRIDPSALARDAVDFRFVDESGLLIPHEVEWISNAMGQADLWIRLPELTSGARVWMYWASASASDAQAPRAVWAAGYAAVWHLGPELLDSTEEHHLEDFGSIDVEGQVARARLLDGETSVLRPISQEGFLRLFDGGGTISAWIRPTGFGQGGYGRIIDNATSTSAENGWYMAINESTEALRFSMDYEGSQPNWESEIELIEIGQWQHVAARYSTSAEEPAATLFIDGVEVPPGTSPNPSGAPMLTSPLSVAIGAVGSGEVRFFDGMIDELRLSTVSRSPEWIAAEVLSSLDQVLDYGSTEALPTPSG